MPDAAVEKNVSERLPEAEAGHGAEGDQAEVMVNPGRSAHAEEHSDERLDEEDAGADEHKELDTGSDEAAPIEVVAAGAKGGRDIQSLRRRNATVKAPFRGHSGDLCFT